jgi:hypothetical protein
LCRRGIDRPDLAVGDMVPYERRDLRNGRIVRGVGPRRDTGARDPAVPQIAPYVFGQVGRSKEESESEDGGAEEDEGCRGCG